jgi:hypothetical protein
MGDFHGGICGGCLELWGLVYESLGQGVGFLGQFLIEFEASLEFA